MTALLAAIAGRHDLDWTGFVVVMTMLALAVVAVAPYTREWWRREEDKYQALVDAAFDAALDSAVEVANEVDHQQCSNPECDQTICGCRTAAECTGCTTLGCSHGEGLCWDCRLGCTACVHDEQVLRDLDWAAGR